MTYSRDPSVVNTKICEHFADPKLSTDNVEEGEDNPEVSDTYANFFVLSLDTQFLFLLPYSRLNQTRQLSFVLPRIHAQRIRTTRMKCTTLH